MFAPILLACDYAGSMAMPKEEVMVMGDEDESEGVGVELRMERMLRSSEPDRMSV